MSDFVPPSWARWIGCRGPWPRLIRWLHKCGFRPATRYALRKCREELERYEREQVLRACGSSGKTVVATRDEAGRLTMRELPGEGEA
jgi:hypothetical protein